MPAVTVNDVLSAFHAHLDALGLVRRPRDAGAEPPMFVEPAGGARTPRAVDQAGDATPEDHATLVVSVFGSQLGEGPLDGYRRRVVVDVRYRSRTTAGLKAARDLDAAIAEAVGAGRPDYGTGWTLGEGTPHEVFVLSSQLYSGLGPISDVAGVRDERASYLFEVLA